MLAVFFFSSRRRHTRFKCDWSSDVCSSDLAVGANVTLIVQVAPATRLAPQLFVSEKSPVAVMLDMLRTAFPEFASVTCCAALIVPGVKPPNVRLDGESAT